MDKTLRIEICAEVKKAVMEANESYTEVWLSADDLLKQFGMFTKEWLKRYGHTLPRTRAEVEDEDGTVHCTRWAYPRNKIQKLISTNKIKRL